MKPIKRHELGGHPHYEQMLSINPQEISGNWRAGWVLDSHKPSRRPLIDRTELGEAVYRLKYRDDRSKIKPIVEIATEFIQRKYKVDDHFVLPHLKAILPVPPSEKNRDFQPVIEIAKEIGNILNLCVRTDYLIKIKQTPLMKNIPSVESKREQLQGAFTVRTHDYKNQCVLLFDDIYDSGVTISETSKVLYEQGRVRHVLVLALTRTQTSSNRDSLFEDSIPF